MSLLTNINSVAFTSLYPVDKVLNIYTGTITIPVRTDSANTVVINTGVEGPVFFAGIFTIDGSDTYTDLGGVEFFDDGVGAYTEFGLDGKSADGTLTLTTVTSDVFTHTCDYKVFTFAQSEQGLFTLEGENRPTILENLSNSRNYQKIYTDTKQPHTVTTAATSSYTVSHDLGYVPSVRAFIEVSGVLYDVAAGPTINTVGFNNCFCELRVSSTDVTVFFINNTGASVDTTIHTRIYADAS